MMPYHKQSNSRKFSTTYDTEEFGQIVVMLKCIGQGMGVDVHFNPPDLGICTLSLTFGTDPETPASTQVAEAFLRKCNESEARNIVRTAVQGMAKSQSETAPHH